MTDSFTIVIFGITSNLSQTKLIPALYDLEEKGYLDKDTKILGIARGQKSPLEFEKYFHQTLHTENRHHKHALKSHILPTLYKKLHYLSGTIEDKQFYPQLLEKLKDLNSKNIIVYLATYPDLYEQIFKGLKSIKLHNHNQGFLRLIIEKPIGNDLRSAKKLNKLLSTYFKEEQIFRLDHYLGKETIQNILYFRSHNSIFEPLINNKYVDHIQITSSEDYGIKDRGGYYDSVGSLRDVGQNHILQMLAFSTMELPKKFTNRAITDARYKLIKSLVPDPKKIVFGQYQGYLKEKNVNPKSKTDTFFATRTFIKNPRFKGVPVYIRAGKNLPTWVTEISIVFKPCLPAGRTPNPPTGGPNTLIYRIQPNEGIIVKISTKKPNLTELDSSHMQYCYRYSSSDLPDAYEKLLLDAISGDQTFFNDAKEVEAQWKFTDPLLNKKPRVMEYKKNTWGPKAADDLIKKDGREWLEPSMLFCNF